MAKRKRGRKAERGPVANPTAIKIPVEIKAAIVAEAALQRRSAHWLICEILSQWFSYYTKVKKK